MRGNRDSVYVSAHWADTAFSSKYIPDFARSTRAGRQTYFLSDRFVNNEHAQMFVSIEFGTRLWIEVQFEDRLSGPPLRVNDTNDTATRLEELPLTSGKRIITTAVQHLDPASAGSERPRGAALVST